MLQPKQPKGKQGTEARMEIGKEKRRGIIFSP